MKQLSSEHENLFKRRKLMEGDLVLKAVVNHIRGLHLPKFAGNCEEPCVIKEARDSGY